MMWSSKGGAEQRFHYEPRAAYGQDSAHRAAGRFGGVGQAGGPILRASGGVSFGSGWRKVRMPRVPRSALNAWSNSIKVEVSFAAKMARVAPRDGNGRGKT